MSRRGRRPGGGADRPAAEPDLIPGRQPVREALRAGRPLEAVVLDRRRGEDLDQIGHAVQLSHRARRIVRQNLVFSVGVMATLVVLALVGQIGLTVGVLGHEGSTIVVVFNGLRLLADRRAG